MIDQGQLAVGTILMMDQGQLAVGTIVMMNQRPFSCRYNEDDESTAS